MSISRKYEIMVLLNEEFNANAVKSWSFNYAKNLKKFNVSDLSVTSHGRKRLSYQINQKKAAHYLQINFSTVPKYITNFSSILKLDSNVTRFIIFNG